jgi:transposase
MRGEDDKQGAMFSLVSPEKRVPAGHPLRPIKKMVDAILRDLSPLFDKMYSDWGRPSVSPERLLKSTLLMAFYSVRSERLFCEQLDYNILFRWFLDMDLDTPGFDHSTFSKNRARLLEHDVAGQFFALTVERARSANLLSDEHFTVDGTLIEAWASLKSFRRKDAPDEKKGSDDDKGNPTVNFHGEKRSNQTHESTTDPEAKLFRKGNGKEAKLHYSAHALMENRHGLLVDFRVDAANGTAERTTAAEMLYYSAKSAHPTVGADKAYDTRDFIADCEFMGVEPHVAANEGPRRSSAVDRRIRRKAGYAVSQRKRKLVEEVFGWIKTVGGFRRTRFKGLLLTQLAAHMVATAYNLLRMAKLVEAV